MTKFDETPESLVLIIRQKFREEKKTNSMAKTGVILFKKKIEKRVTGNRLEVVECRLCLGLGVFLRTENAENAGNAKGRREARCIALCTPEQSLRASESRGWKMFFSSLLPPSLPLLSSLTFNSYLARRWSFSQRRLEAIEICFACFELDANF